MSKLPIHKDAAAAATLWLLETRGVAESDLDFFTRQLGESESGRLRSFLRPERRRQFLLGRMLLRYAVSNLTGLPAGMIGIVERRGNAPRLVLPGLQRSHPHFSISHSGDWVACLVSRNAAVGLDIEVQDPARDIDAISEAAFLPDERLWLSSSSRAERLESFYDLWCQKEALHKLLCNLSEDRNGALDQESLCWHRYSLNFSGVCVVALSDRPLITIREKLFTQFTRWSAAAEHSRADRAWLVDSRRDDSEARFY